MQQEEIQSEEGTPIPQQEELSLSTLSDLFDLLYRPLTEVGRDPDAMTRHLARDVCPIRNFAACLRRFLGLKSPIQYTPVA